jgi:hypothetical protein
MTIGIVCEPPSANEIIVGGSQRSWKHLASTDEPAIEFLLNAIMSPLRLAELRELDQRRDLGLEYSKIRSAGAGVKVSLCIGSLSRGKAIVSFC